MSLSGSEKIQAALSILIKANVMQTCEKYIDSVTNPLWVGCTYVTFPKYLRKITNKTSSHLHTCNHHHTESCLRRPPTILARNCTSPSASSPNSSVNPDALDARERTYAEPRDGAAAREDERESSSGAGIPPADAVH